MSFSNPRRRTPVTRPGSDCEHGLSLKTAMILRKGATFHSPTSPSATASDDDFVPPRLTRSQSDFDDVVDASRRRIALTLNDIDEALSKAQDLSLSDKSPRRKTLRDTSLPVPRGFLDLPIVDPAMNKPESERRVLRPRSVRRTRNHASDSGIGSSVVSTNDKSAAADSAKKPQASALTRSAASSTTAMLPSLSHRAVNRIREHTLRPLLEKPTLKEFQPIVLDVPRRIRSKEIICLRDLEKTLIFMAPVSRLLTDDGVWGDAYRMLRQKEKAKSAALYLDFCLTSVRCIQATVEYLTDREQIRPGDRPYTNGYFIDLKEQIYQYGKQLAAIKEKGSLADDMDIDQSDEVRLYGGIAENGRPAELVRIKKDGTAISMATGKVIDMGESPTPLKRSLSEQREDEEEIMRSMARRKKNASPEELAPKKCREPGCTKEFKRPCDLTKHEKTHSRPWKCPIPTCKYHDYGWPTEKEMDRHINDKHSDAPAMFECLFKPCPYKSKRESNCKQHMEKAHGWTYVRTKTNGKKAPSQNGSVAQQTPPLGSVSTPSTTPTYSVPTPPQEGAGQVMTSDFPLYPADADWFATYGMQPDTIDAMDLGLENPSPASAASSYEQYPPYQNGSTFIINDEDIYAAHAQIPAQLPTPEQVYSKMMPQQMPIYHTQPQPCATVPMMGQQQQFSPNAQQNAVLYTPTSLREVDEGFDESYATDGADFQLFPASLDKTNVFQSLFTEMPSANLGFSQTTQPDIFQQIDWTTLDYQGFQD
ncbi:zinc finger transcription factor ace1 [Trichoderma arundinaceum]|uniref:Zinc finger transcription factor ace1 n=1 Tax=Trichoderma arundinaceum TaxID=490622 RepID=A0A395NED2_TRIAR|nr:zinc finger transcription factor ace1 [Trichoderma arundinaceum]